MGNYSILWIAKDKEKYNEDTDKYLEVKYAIPLFWIALFTVEDITTRLCCTNLAWKAYSAI